MTETATAYRVLARKYRPASFDGLIGQEAMVRTLSNAIDTGRIAHAFILTGVRGVGKTTTARIIARALNCVGEDGTGGPTVQPCGACVHCRSIGEDRHVDVMEMDAASRTGVDDIRELTDGVRYRPVSARFKIYIIDEVHMLSKNAFNALLKTLEEPPPDVKFIFATTEINKVPITVLSRCQRFSLRRVPLDLLSRHYAGIAEAEGVKAEAGALALIARAADGSVRDGLSLLDQAIALSGEAIGEEAVRDMLGIADRGLVFDILEAVFRGDGAAALEILARLHRDGADPLTILQDLLDLTHLLTRLKVAPEAGAEDPAAEADRERALPVVQRLGMPVLARSWQMLLKGLSEVQLAPSPMQAAEMVLIRLAYVADLPAPADLIRTISQGGSAASPGVSSSRAQGGGDRQAIASVQVRADSAGSAASIPASRTIPASMAPRAARGESVSAGRAMAALPHEMPSVEMPPLEAVAEPETATAAPSAEPAALPMPQSFAELMALFEERREPLVRSHLWAHVHLVHFEPGHVEFRPADGAPRDLANKLGKLLDTWTGTRWVVAISGSEGAPTLREQEERRALDLRNEVAQHPLVLAVLENFPGATIEVVRERFPTSSADQAGETGDPTAEGDDRAEDEPSAESPP